MVIYYFYSYALTAMSSIQDNIESENLHLHEVEKILTRKAAFQALLMKISNEYINIPLEKSSEAINNSLKEIGTFVDADRSYIFEYNHETKTTSNLYEHCIEGIQPEIQNLQEIPYEYLPDWITNHFNGKLIYIPEVEKLPEGNLRDLLSAQNIKSLITLPMMDGSTCLGFIGFDAVRNHRVYTQDEIDLLKLYSQMLINLKLRTHKENEVNDFRAKLQESLEREIELNRMKSNFITMTSHQFRSPLTSIQASADLLKLIIDNLQVEKKEKLEKHLSRIFAEVDRINSLMNEVRFLGRAVNDKVSFEPISLDILAMIQHLIEGTDLHPGDPRKPSINVTGTPFHITADERLLSQAIHNILNNALKFSAGRPSPEVCLDFAADSLKIKIVDQGIGIPGEFHQELYKSFTRASNVENLNGTGLGLAITKHIMDLHKAGIQVRSTLGKGTTVELSFKS